MTISSERLVGRVFQCDTLSCITSHLRYAFQLPNSRLTRSNAFLILFVCKNISHSRQASHAYADGGSHSLPWPAACTVRRSSPTSMAFAAFLCIHLWAVCLLWSSCFPTPF